MSGPSGQKTLSPSEGHPVNFDWVENYIGLPYLDKGRSRDGLDCWGLVWLVYRDHLGIDLPSYDDEYINSAEQKEIAAIVAREAASALWTRVTEPRALDIIWFRRGRLDAHAALWLKPGLMLHMREEDASKAERFDVPEWQSRVTGIYRWSALA